MGGAPLLLAHRVVREHLLGFGPLALADLVAVAVDGDASQDRDHGHHDHELDQGEAPLLFHGGPLRIC
jgi:hypothetical protein